MSPQEQLIFTLKTRQTRELIDHYGIHIAKIAEQSRDMALVAWALVQNNEEKRRNLLVEISQQVSDVTNLMMKLKGRQDA
jgi:hypothetical protein